MYFGSSGIFCFGFYADFRSLNHCLLYFFKGFIYHLGNYSKAKNNQPNVFLFKLDLSLYNFRFFLNQFFFHPNDSFCPFTELQIKTVLRCDRFTTVKQRRIKLITINNDYEYSITKFQIRIRKKGTSQQ